MVVFAIAQFIVIIVLAFYIRKIKKEKSYLEYYDELTGLPNRNSLRETLSKLLQDNKNLNISLLYINIDNFKYINELLGHSNGDLLICNVSERLALLLKDGCSLFKLDGDEFVIAIQDIKEADSAELYASYVHAAFKEKFVLEAMEIYINLSIGVVINTEQGLSFDELLKHAEIALCKAKLSGKNKYVIYDKSMKEDRTKRALIEKHMHSALSNGEFELFYQPQLCLNNNKISGLEALLRWNSPQLGVVSPGVFIQVAEDSHLIIPLGTWVIRKACEFFSALREKGYENLSISINISILQLLQPDFNEVVQDALDFYMLTPESVELEITETIMINSFDIILEKLMELKRLGVRIALDDFGKGYSSLSRLRQLPVSTLKIDKSFIDKIGQEEKDTSLVEQIISIGKILGMSVVAEGVENRRQLQYLTQNKCDKIQGFYFSKPLSEKDTIKLIDDYKREN